MSLKEKDGMRIVSVRLRMPPASVSGRGQFVIPRQCLPNVEKFDVVVAEIINPGHFYLQRGKSSQDFRCLVLVACISLKMGKFDILLILK